MNPTIELWMGGVTHDKMPINGPGRPGQPGDQVGAASVPKSNSNNERPHLRRQLDIIGELKDTETRSVVVFPS